ncbi:MAG: hypothetical protein ACQESR_23690 [Planctomycetota bacterium]
MDRFQPALPKGAPNSTAPLEPSCVGRIALLVNTYGEMDPIEPSPPSGSPTAQGRWGPAVAPESGAVQLNTLVADDFLRRESDQREDDLRRAAFHLEKLNRLKYNGSVVRCR